MLCHYTGLDKVMLGYVKLLTEHRCRLFLNVYLKVREH